MLHKLKNLPIGYSLACIVCISMVIHFGSLGLGLTILQGWTWVNEPFHSIIEISGSIIAFQVAYLLYKLNQQGAGTSFNLCISSALVSMGIFDGVHAFYSPGQSFVWFHSISTFFGGIWFLTIWLPKSWFSNYAHQWLRFSCISALGLTGVYTYIPELIPPMLEDGKFTNTAIVLNIVGGIGFLLASVKLIQVYLQSKNHDDLLFFCHSLLFGGASILFYHSIIWDFAWWGWHILRFLAYAVALWFAFKTDLVSQIKIQQDKNKLQAYSNEKAELIEAIFELSVDAMITMDSKGTILTMNPSAESMFGYGKNEAIGKNIHILMPPSFAEKHDSYLENYYKTGYSEVIGVGREVQALTKYGKIFPIFLSVTEVKTEQSTIFSGIIRDLSDITAKEEALKELTSRLEFALTAPRIGIWEYDIEHNKLIWDNMMFELYGVQKNVFSNCVEAWEACMHPEDLQENRKLMLYCFEQGLNFHSEFRIVWPNKEIRHIESHAKLFENHDGRLTRMVGTNFDITDQKNLATEREIAVQKAEESAQLKSEFLACMSHEIRTPMNGVLGMLNLLKKDGLNERQMHKLDLAKTSAESLLTIINDILDFSKIEAHNLTLSNTEFDLIELLSDFVESINTKAQEKNLELTLDVHDVQQSRVVGDPNRLQQILFNLVGNAIKFTTQGEIVITVKLKELKNKSYILHCSVRDTGKGITPEKLDKIFESFTQEDNSSTRSYGGTGLGLSIVKQLCELMNGVVTVNSHLNQGSTFNFTARLKKPLVSKSTQPESAITDLKCLVADSHPTSQKQLTTQLTQWFINTDSVQSGEEVIDILSRNTPETVYDLVFIQHDLNDLKALDVIKRVNQIKPNHLFKWILIAPLKNIDSSLDDYQQIGIDLTIPKPVTLHYLYTALEIHAEQAMKPKPPESSGIPLPTENPVSQISSSKVLLVEDNEINQEVILSLLEDFPIKCHTANNGVEALKALQQESSFDVILMDCQMPEMDGYEATRHIRQGDAGEHNKNITIIALTANAMKGDREKCLDSGMDDYLSKPIDHHELEKRLSIYLKNLHHIDANSNISSPLPPHSQQ